MNLYTVNYEGKPVRVFSDMQEALKYQLSIEFQHQHMLRIEKALENNPLTEAKEALNFIMRK